jgi:uncharacterized protein (TIGR02599 family)
VEVLVSTAILTLLMVMMAEALNTTQRSWLASRAAVERQQAVDAATGTLSRGLRQATLQTRAGYDTTMNQTVRDSDLHFVCGPAAELIGGVNGVCGDAVFFQRPAVDGPVPGALQACGFFVQYGGDEAWRPSFSTAIPVRRRFRLLQFHQPAGSLTLFQPTSVMGERSRLAQMTSRNDLYQWFAQPVGDSTAYASMVSLVAENVVAMIVQTAPGTARCYDTRRHQWEAGSADAVLSRHQLPGTMEVTLVMVDEAGWSRLAADEAETVATAVVSFVKGHIPGAISFHWARLMEKDNTHKFKPIAEVKAELEKAGITPDKNIIAYCGTSREGSLLQFYLKHVAGYPNVRLYEGAWKEYVWLQNKSLPAETGGDPAGDPAGSK